MTKPVAEEKVVVPRYLPLHRDMNREFEKTTAFKNPLGKQIQELVDMALVDSDCYIDYMLGENNLDVHEVLEANLKNLEGLLKSLYELEVYRELIDHTKNQIKEHNLAEPELSLATVDEFSENGGTNFSERFAREYRDNASSMRDSGFQAYLSRNKSYRELKNVMFVITHPEDPIPDEEEDEELKVSGGKISLKDPLSLNYFVDPVITKKCRHTFERQTILSHLVSSQDCPITGCTEKIVRTELEDDKLMRIRVKVYLQKERTNKRVARVV